MKTKTEEKKLLAKVKKILQNDTYPSLIKWVEEVYHNNCPYPGDRYIGILKVDGEEIKLEYKIENYEAEEMCDACDWDNPISAKIIE